MIQREEISSLYDVYFNTVTKSDAIPTHCGGLYRGADSGMSPDVASLAAFVKLVEQPATILDLGAGVTSYVFRSLFSNVVTIDHDQVYLEFVRSICRKNGLSDANFLCGMQHVEADYVFCDYGTTDDRIRLMEEILSCGKRLVWVNDADDRPAVHLLVKSLRNLCRKKGVVFEPRLDVCDKYGRYGSIIWLDKDLSHELPTLVEYTSTILQRKVRILAPDNAYGLSRDREIMTNAFWQAGWDVEFGKPRDRSASSVPVQVHLEILAGHLLSSAQMNVLIPNPEWWEADWTSFLSHPSLQVWAKSRDAARIFSDLDARVETIGFCSIDQRDETVLRERRFLHVAGHSPNKGTVELISNWPSDGLPLTVVSSLPGLPIADNVTLLQHCDPSELRRLQNTCIFHIYPSRYEGFGHALWEGLSCGAVVFATGAPPFNEQTGAFLLLSATCGSALGRLVTGAEVSTWGFAAAAAWAREISENDLARYQSQARLAWEQRAADFTKRLDSVFAILLDRAVA